MNINAYDIGYKVKSVATEIKDIDMEQRMIEGYFSAFDFVDSDGDMLKRGCYQKTIKENGPGGKNRIMHLLQHDVSRPLGKPIILMEDDYGLNFRTVISETSYGTDTLKLYQDGVYTEHSVGINLIKAEYSQEDRANIVTEVRMWEGSTVTWGANEQALGGMMKGEFEDVLERYNTLSKAFYSGDYTDDTFIILEKQKNFIEQHIKEALLLKKPSADTSEAEAVDALFTKHKQQLNLKRLFNGRS